MLLFSDWLLWLAALALAGWLYLIFGRGAFWRAEVAAGPGRSVAAAPTGCGRGGAGAQRGGLCRPHAALADRPGLSRPGLRDPGRRQQRGSHPCNRRSDDDAAGPPARGDRRAPSAGRLVGQAVGGVRRAPTRLRTDAGRAVCPAHRCRRPARSRQSPPAGRESGSGPARPGLAHVQAALPATLGAAADSALRLLLSRALSVRRGQPAATQPKPPRTAAASWCGARRFAASAASSRFTTA